MEKYSIIKFLCCLFITTMHYQLLSYDSNKLDVMIDFAYPVSGMEYLRNDMSQAFYSLQHKDIQATISFLEQGLSSLQSRKVVNNDDYEFIQEMIDKINSLIESIEDDSQRSVVIDLSDQIKNNL